MLQRLTSKFPVLLALLLVLSLAGCGSAPTMGKDPETLGAVDALFTALTSQRTELLDHCEADLRKLHAGGKLPDAAQEHLTGIIAEARSGQWRPAAEKLNRFIKAQRG